MQPASDFALQLAVGVKDIYSDKVDAIKTASAGLRAETERLQKDMGNISAYKKADAAVSKLAKKEGDLRKELQATEKRKKALAKQRDAILKKQKAGTKLSQAEQRELQNLNRELEEATRKEQDLGRELEQTTREAKDQSRALNKMGSQLNKAGIDTKDLRGELKKLRSQMAEVGKEAKKTEGMETGLGNLAKGAAAVAAGGGFLATMTGQVQEFEAASRSIVAGTELTLEHADSVRKLLRGAYEDLNGNVELDALAQSTTDIIQQMDMQKEAAAETAKQVHMLTNVYAKVDAHDAIKAADQVTKAWKDTSANVALDVFAAVLEKSGDKAGDMADSFHEYATSAAEIGVSYKQYAAMLAGGAQAGAHNFDVLGDILKETRARVTDLGQWEKVIGKGSKSGLIDELMGDDQAAAKRLKTSLARFRSGMISGNKELTTQAYADLLQQLGGLQAKNAQVGKQLVEALSGTRAAEDVTPEILQSMAESMRNADAVLGNYKGKTQAAFEERQTYLDNLKGAWVGLTGALAEGVRSLGTHLEPVGEWLIGLVEGVTGLVKAMPQLSAAVVALGASFVGLKTLGVASVLAKGAYNAVRGKEPGDDGKGKNKKQKKAKGGLLSKLVKGASGLVGGSVGALAKGAGSLLGGSVGAIAKGAGKMALRAIPVVGAGLLAYDVAKFLHGQFAEPEAEKTPQTQTTQKTEPAPAQNVNITPPEAGKTTPAATPPQPGLAHYAQQLAQGAANQGLEKHEDGQENKVQNPLVVGALPPQPESNLQPLKIPTNTATPATTGGIQSTIGQITFSPQFNVQAAPGDDPEVISQAILATLREGSTELVLEMKRLLEEVWQSEEYRTNSF